MLRVDARLLALPALLVGVAGCLPNSPVPGAATGVLNGSWSVTDVTTHQTGTFPLINGKISITSQGGPYQVIFFASSPNGVTQANWSGSGNFTCEIYGKYQGPEPSIWLPTTSLFNPPQPTGALYNSNFVLPCSPGFANTGSTQSITAHAADATGATITGTMTLTVSRAGL
jgi:hypothetical protein